MKIQWKGFDGMTEEKFIEVIKSLFEEDVDVSMDAELEDMEEWDSLTRVKFMVMMSQEYNICLPRFDVAEAETIGELYELVEENS